MDRYVSDPLAVPSGPYRRADVIFFDVDHSGPSFQARIFFDRPDADETTPLDADHGYAGAFHIFGHGGCFGDHGHCELPSGARDPFDLRPAHQLTPQTKTVIVTEALQLHSGDSVRLTVVPVIAPALKPQRENILHLSGVRLVTYL